jgi:hypothetical protein
MRALISQLLPKSGVLGVPSVLTTENKENIRTRALLETGTPSHTVGVPDVPNATAEHLVKNDVFQEIPNKINTRTPRTLGTPIFTKEFIEAYEERAAIMEFDGGMRRQEAETAATFDLLKNENDKGTHGDLVPVAYEQYNVTTFIKNIEERIEVLTCICMMDYFEAVSQAYEECRNEWLERIKNDPNN